MPTYTYTDTVVPPTCTQQGYTHHECSEDSSKSFDDTYTDALGHDFQNGACTRCNEPDPNYVAPAPEPTPTEPPADPTAPPPAESTGEPSAPASESDPVVTE